MAINDRGRRSFQFNKLTGFATVSYCVLAICALQPIISASKPGMNYTALFNDTRPTFVLILPDFDQPPTSVITYLGEFATFQCSTNKEGNIFWYVNDMYALGLPLEYEASFMEMPTANYINSTLRLRAVEQANNSQIMCAVEINRRENRTYFPSAILQVQGNTCHALKRSESLRTRLMKSHWFCSIIITSLL